MRTMQTRLDRIIRRMRPLAHGSCDHNNKTCMRICWPAYARWIGHGLGGILHVELRRLVMYTNNNSDDHDDGGAFSCVCYLIASACVALNLIVSEFVA